MKNFSLLLLVVGCARAVEFDYEQYGADWTGICATGRSQSPVALDTLSATETSFIVQENEPSPGPGTLKNNGHSLVFTPDNAAQTTVRNPLNGASYTLEQLHFHWDESATRVSLGSEHTLDGKAYPLECHFVHYKTEYGSLGASLAANDGLMVVGQFYEIDNSASNVALNTLLSASRNVIPKDAEYNVTETVSVLSLMTDRSDMFHYSGSLTTPTCNEVVSWYVFREVLGVPLRQLKKLFVLHEDDAGHHTIAHNWRPVQPLNGRTVYRNFDVQLDDSSSETPAYGDSDDSSSDDDSSDSDEGYYY